jgi:hypothetical protein
VPVVKLCAQRGCGQYATDGRHCDTHAAVAKTVMRIRKDAQHKAKGYSSANWQKVRLQRLELDQHLCTIQLPGCERIATTVDLHPSLNGDHRLATIETTRSACRHCHGAADGGRRTGAAAHHQRQWEAAFSE